MLIDQQNDADVDVIDYDGWSALHHACFGGHLGCVQVLLDSQVLVDNKDKVWHSSMLAAFCRNLIFFAISGGFNSLECFVIQHICVLFDLSKKQ